MPRIVKEPIKVDFHIHSIASKWIDGDKVKNSKIENLNILIKKLNDNKINMVSITDHDNFDYDIYHKLKQEEQKTSSCIKKVIPGVEFDVKIDKQILHIIALFDDSDDDKIKLIHSKIFDDKANKPKFKSFCNNYFSKEEFLDVLRHIDINFCLIAHQKGSPYSERKRKRDFNNLSKLTQNELLCVGFFDAFEFRNKNNEIFNKLYANDTIYKSNEMNYITGSDSHDWDIYPNNSKDDKFDNFTYLKCLPSFRGLTLALTSKSRIYINTSNFFSCTNNIDAIDLSINNNSQKVELSNGINAIIGDNSIGKSLLLHKLTNYDYIGHVGVKKTSYEQFLKSNKIEINNFIDKGKIFRFDCQGDIRKLFENGKTKTVFDEYYPQNVNSYEIKNELLTKIDNFINFLKNKNLFCKQLMELSNINIEFDESKVSEFKSLQIDNDLNHQMFKTDNETLQKIKNTLNEVCVKIDKILEYELFQDSDKSKILKYKKGIEKLFSKYDKIYNQKTFEQNKISIISHSLDDLNDKLRNEKTFSQSSYEEYNKNFLDLAKKISNTIKNKNKLNFNLEIDDKFKNINPNISTIGKYSFVSKTKCTNFDKNYIFNLLKKPLRKKYANSLSIERIDEIDSEEFKENINLQNETDDIFNKYKEKIETEICKDVEIDNYITLKELDLNNKLEINKLSNGTNALIFLDLLSYKDESGIYLIDQPEDDVSQKSIHDKLIPYLQKISHKHQILLITHNPQLVVNLDVDNVIFMNKDDKTGEISIKYGALEYKNAEDNTDILDIIVKNLEGGLNALKERYNKYEKNN